MERVAHFRIREVIGRGGMGVVYRATDEQQQRDVALKVLPLDGDEERRKRFLREGRLATSLHHPNIAACYEVGEVDGAVFLALELVQGESLSARLRRGRPSLAETLSIARGIARGLAHAHALGIIHRDIKPDNIVITPEGEARVLDFGLARREQVTVLSPSSLESRDTTIETEAGRAIGTPGYMAPEQVRGERADPRADLFALGAVLYEMATGVAAFPGDKVTRVLATVRDQPRPPRERAASLPARAERIILRCLAKVPADRPASAAAVLRELDAVATGARQGRRVLVAGVVLTSVMGIAGWVALHTAAVPHPPTVLAASASDTAA